MNGRGRGEDSAAAPSSAPEPLEWKFSQVFGERTAGEEVQEVDIISAIEFDTSGDLLATGDRGGRVVLFERTDAKEHGSRRDLEKLDYAISGHPEFRYKTEFQSHESELCDFAISLTISKAWKQKRKLTRFDGVKLQMVHYFFYQLMTKQSNSGRCKKRRSREFLR